MGQRFLTVLIVVFTTLNINVFAASTTDKSNAIATGSTNKHSLLNGAIKKINIMAPLIMQQESGDKFDYIVGHPEIAQVNGDRFGEPEFKDYDFYLIYLPLDIPTTSAMHHKLARLTLKLSFNNMQDDLDSIANSDEKPFIVSFFPTHEFLDTTESKSSFTGQTLAPSAMFMTLGNLSHTSNRVATYNYHAPLVIGELNNKLSQISWEFSSLSKGSVRVGSFPTFILVRTKRGNTGPLYAQAALEYARNMFSGKCKLFAGPIKIDFSNKLHLKTIVSLHNSQLPDSFVKALYLIDPWSANEFGEAAKLGAGKSP